MDIAEFIERGVRVPFVVGGRSFDGWDCWGLIYVAYRDVFGVEINKLAIEYDPSSTPHDEIDRLANQEKSEWIDVFQPRFGDIALYRVGRYQSHVSLVLPANRMIHSERKIGTHSDRLDNLIWAQRNVGYFRRREGIGGDPSVTVGSR